MILHPVIPNEIAERFRSYLELKSNGCIEWSGGTVRDGYGWFNHAIPEISNSAHRFAFALHHGFIDDSLSVLHKCDNPPCCNWKHLFQGDHQLNADDMKAKGRSPKQRGASNPNAVLSDAQVIEIRRIREETGLQYKQIAELFPVTPEMISLICRRKYRNDI